MGVIPTYRMSQDLNMGKAYAHAPILKCKPVLTIVFCYENADIYALVGEAVYSRGNCRGQCYCQNRCRFEEPTVGQTKIGKKT